MVNIHGMGALSVIRSIAFTAFVICALTFPIDYSEPIVGTKQKEEGFFRRNPGFAAIMVGSTLVYFCQTLMNNNGYQVIVSKGGDNVSHGIALAIAMIDANRFDRESYALNHPAGAIGRALILKVSDIMRTGERFARVSPETTVLDSLMAMTKAQGGSAVVAAEDGTLAGIFTDGDFRRILRTHSGVNGTNGLDLLAQPVSAYMTRKPLFIRDDAYAADLLKVFERRRIDDLPVVDAAGKVVGLVDIQDLPKMKVL